MHLTYQTSQLSLAYLKRAQNTFSKKNAGTIVHCRVSVVSCRAHVLAWELQPSADARHHEGVSYHRSLVWDEIKIQNF